MAFHPVIPLPDWPLLEPLLHRYRDTAPRDSTALKQQRPFMVALITYLETAFAGWQVESAAPESQGHLSIQTILRASSLSADPLGKGAEAAMRDVACKPDDFRHACKESVGLTPQKFREMKRMEFAANRLGRGLSVKDVASELGSSEPYFLSRMFKRHFGASPSVYRGRPKGEDG